MRGLTARQLVKAAAAGIDVVHRPPPGLVVLIYHRVGRRASIEVDLPRSEFEAQVEWLANHATVLPLTEALTRVMNPHAPVEPIVAVTFDDGTADFADEAVPVLARYGVPATLYVATAFIDERRSFPDDGAPISWAALRDAASTGLVDVGSHTHQHALLDRLAPPLVAGELDRSIELIGEHIGHARALRVPQGGDGLAHRRGRRAQPLSLRGCRGHEGEPLRRDGSVPPRTLADPAERRSALVRAQGTRRARVRRHPPAGRQPEALRKRRQLGDC